MNAYGAISVGTSAASIVAANNRRERVLIQNIHASQDLYLGFDSSVTSSNGLKVAAGQSVEVKTQAAIFGIGSGAATTGRYLEEA